MQFFGLFGYRWREGNSYAEHGWVRRGGVPFTLEFAGWKMQISRPGPHGSIWWQCLYRAESLIHTTHQGKYSHVVSENL